MSSKLTLTGRLSEEVAKSDAKRSGPCGLYHMYMRGKGVDIGYTGHKSDTVPVNGAMGIDLHTPGYDGVNLPVADRSLDYVFSSHMLEHVPTDKVLDVWRSWHRALRAGGHIVTIVPHGYLYERKRNLPSKWNRGHYRFYTPGVLLSELEAALAPNSYRVMHVRDNADGYDYSVPPTEHAQGCYEIELVIKKIEPPEWDLLP